MASINVGNLLLLLTRAQGWGSSAPLETLYTAGVCFTLARNTHLMPMVEIDRGGDIDPGVLKLFVPPLINTISTLATSPCLRIDAYAARVANHSAMAVLHLPMDDKNVRGLGDIVFC